MRAKPRCTTQVTFAVQTATWRMLKRSLPVARGRFWTWVFL